MTDTMNALIFKNAKSLRHYRLTFFFDRDKQFDVGFCPILKSVFSLDTWNEN